MIRRFLHIDEASRELRLVILDFDSGRNLHERTEFRVTGSSGDVLRGAERWGHLEGARVALDSGLHRYYIPRASLADRETYLTIQDQAIGVTEQTPCLRGQRDHRGRRLRCPLCEADAC